MRAMIPFLRRAGALVAAAALACGRGDVDSPDPGRRALGVRALARAGGDSPLAALLVAQRDPSPVVRTAAAEAFAARGGAGSADALGKLLADPAPEVASAAAKGLSAMPNDPRARQHLVAAYAAATPGGRAAIADALERIGVSLREAVESEARFLWERNLAALDRATGAARGGAAEEIGASARADAVQRLVPLVDPDRNRDRPLAAAAARGLGESGDWTARPFLEALLQQDDDAFLAESAASALGRLGDPRAADSLAAVATAEPGRVATAAADALAALPEAPEVGIALCELAIRTPDPAVAARAAREARRRDAECPERPLLAKLGRPGALAALSAVAELAPKGEAAGSAVSKVVLLLDPARAPDPAVRAAAARVLGRLGGPAAATAVARRLEAVSARIGERRARWIPGPPPGSAPPEWIDAVGADDARELGGLLSVAGRLHVEGAEALLLAWARDPLVAVRAGDVEGLSLLGTAGALDVVAGALEDVAPEVRLAAAEGLGRFGARGAPALARAAAAAASPDWRVALARALGDTGSAEAIPALARLLDGDSAAPAAAALARIGAPGGAAPLATYLDRPQAPARAEVVEALAQLAARDAAPTIAALLTDDRPDVRATAARALGRLRHEAASARLEALRSDYYGRVRRAAVEALSKLPAGAPRRR